MDGEAWRLRPLPTQEAALQTAETPLPHARQPKDLCSRCRSALQIGHDRENRAFAPRPAADIARRARHRCTATSHAPTTLPHRRPRLWGPARPFNISKTRHRRTTHFARHNDALRRLHDAPVPALHASTADVSAARPIDAVEDTASIHSEPGVSGIQTGDCCVLRDGGACSAHRPDRDQRRPRRP